MFGTPSRGDIFLISTDLFYSTAAINFQLYVTVKGYTVFLIIRLKQYRIIKVIKIQNVCRPYIKCFLHLWIRNATICVSQSNVFLLSRTSGGGGVGNYKVVKCQNQRKHLLELARYLLLCETQRIRLTVISTVLRLWFY